MTHHRVRLGFLLMAGLLCGCFSTRAMGNPQGSVGKQVKVSFPAGRDLHASLADGQSRILAGTFAVEGRLAAATLDSLRIEVEKVTTAAGEANVAKGTTVALELEPRMDVQVHGLNRRRTGATVGVSLGLVAVAVAIGLVAVAAFSAVARN